MGKKKLNGKNGRHKKEKEFADTQAGRRQMLKNKSELLKKREMQNIR